MAVLGAGKSGVAAARLGRREGAVVSVRDDGVNALSREVAEALGSAGVELLTGEAALDGVEGFDFAVLSPGIEAKSPLARAFSERGVPLVGEIEFADRFSDKPVIAITGTNGKTTTTEIVARILSANGQKTEAAGNHGKAYSQVVLEDRCEVITLEVSSFQLEGIVDFRPEISLWLNFAPDHLDRYESVEEYREAKKRIFENQTRDDFAVINSVNDLGSLVPQTVTFSAFDDSADYCLRGREIFFRGEPVCDFGTCRLRGTHNAENLMAALAVGRLRGVPFPACERAVADYESPPHRSELVATVAGHEFINDSKATNLHALESALLSQSAPVVLIAGGKNKGLPFANLAAVVAEKTTHVVAIGEVRESLAESWSHVVGCETAENLEEAVQKALASAAPGQTILFSPGTSSFDMFRNYEDRGDAFRKITTKLQ